MWTSSPTADSTLKWTSSPSSTEISVDAAHGFAVWSTTIVVTGAGLPASEGLPAVVVELRSTFVAVVLEDYQEDDGDDHDADAKYH